MGIKPETLESGAVLKALILQFLEDRKEETLYPVLQCLRDSLVWIPGTMQMNEEDLQKFANGKVGDTISNDYEIKFVPDILQNGDEKFFPVFSSAEEMGDYGAHFSKVQKHFFEAMSYAVGKEETVGIVVNAFSTPFVVPKAWFDTIGHLPTMLDLDEEPTNQFGSQNLGRRIL